MSRVFQTTWLLGGSTGAAMAPSTRFSLSAAKPISTKRAKVAMRSVGSAPPSAVPGWRTASPMAPWLELARKGTLDRRAKIGRASGGERVCQYVVISVGAVAVKKKEKRQRRK